MKKKEDKTRRSNERRHEGNEEERQESRKNNDRRRHYENDYEIDDIAADFDQAVPEQAEGDINTYASRAAIGAKYPDPKDDLLRRAEVILM